MTRIVGDTHLNDIAHNRIIADWFEAFISIFRCCNKVIDRNETRASYDRIASHGEANGCRITTVCGANFVGKRIVAAIIIVGRVNDFVALISRRTPRWETDNRWIAD